MEQVVRRFITPLQWVLVIAPLVWIGAQGFTGGLGANPIEELERVTGLWTLRMLAASLAISPLMKATGWGWLIPQRRFLGLTAFAYASLHLLVFVGLDHFFAVGDIVSDVLEHLYVTVGMAAFLMLLPLAITSTKGWIRRLGGKRWKQLHRLVYLAAIAGCVHFLWAVKKDLAEPLLYIAIFVVLFAVRIVQRVVLKRRAAGRTSTANARTA